MKLAVFDFDSTLMDGETIDILAQAFNMQEEIFKIVKLQESNKIDFFKSLTTRVSLLKGFEIAKAKLICKNLPYMPGAKETIKALKSKGYIVLCFSGGFDIATLVAKKDLGFDEDFSNILDHKNGKLTGLVNGNMMFDDSKGKMIIKLQNLLGISIKDTVVVGDGANDCSMFDYANIKVAFCAKEILKKCANIHIKTKDLTLILKEL